MNKLAVMALCGALFVSLCVTAQNIQASGPTPEDQALYKMVEAMYEQVEQVHRFRWSTFAMTMVLHDEALSRKISPFADVVEADTIKAIRKHGQNDNPQFISVCRALINQRIRGYVEGYYRAANMYVEDHYRAASMPRIPKTDKESQQQLKEDVAWDVEYVLGNKQITSAQHRYNQSKQKIIDEMADILRKEANK